MSTKPFSDLIEATGLPAKAVESELQPLAEGSGKSLDEMTLDDLREVVAEYLQDTFTALKDELEGQDEVPASVDF